MVDSRLDITVGHLNSRLFCGAIQRTCYMFVEASPFSNTDKHGMFNALATQICRISLGENIELLLKFDIS